MPVDTSALLADFQRWCETVVDDATTELLDRLERRVPVSSGTRLNGPALRDTREWNVNGTTASIGYTAEHASFTDEGTGPHEIRGNPLLAFQWGGQTVIVHSVQHPGTQGTHWWSDEIDDAGWQAALEAAAERTSL